METPRKRGGWRGQQAASALARTCGGGGDGSGATEGAGQATQVDVEACHEDGATAGHVAFVLLHDRGRKSPSASWTLRATDGCARGGVRATIGCTSTRRRPEMIADSVERKIRIDAPVDVVWRVVTEPGEIPRWFSDEAELDPRPGGNGVLTFRNEDNGHEKVVAPVVVVRAE